MGEPNTGNGGYSNPVRLSVKTSDATATAGPSNYGEKERLLRAKKRNEEVRRKGDQWADKLMEETVDQGTFKRALRYITPSQYEVIIHERHLNSHCSYPLCPNPPAEPYNSARRFKISTTNRSITEVEGNKDEGFCSKVCGVRSKWVKGQLDLAGSVLDRGKTWTVELTEEMGLDIEGRMKELGVVDRFRRVSRNTTAKTERKETFPLEATSTTSPSLRALAPALGASSGGLIPSSSSSPASKVQVDAPPAPLPDVIVPTDLLSGLRIHERPTPKKAIPPSLIPPPPSASASHQTPKSTTAAGTSSAPSVPTRRAPPTSILGEQSKLAQTVLKASKAINPEPQINPDSEDEAEHPELEWEREVGLGWGGSGVRGVEGEGEEGDLWAMMREAREMEGE